MIAQVLHLSIVYVLAAVGGAITERSGVVDLAIEAKLLFGAFAAGVVGHATGNMGVAIAAALAAGMLVALVQVALAVVLRADGVIVGVGLNLLALGGTRFLLQLLYGETSSSPPSPSFGTALIGDPIAWLALVAAIGAPIALARTRWGLRLRAAGDRPDALVSVGASVTRARLAAALVGGALAGAGGAQLSLAVGGFGADMSGGRGYIALAMVILSGWRLGLAALACVGLGLAEAVTIKLQFWTAVPRDLVQLLPYVAVLVVLLLVDNSKRRPPAALGK